MPRTHFSTVAILVFVSLACADRPAAAQEVLWRHDYAKARREATETGKPLLLDFGTESCFWCKKLDATTFRDPKIVKMLNENFIPVKVDGNRDQRLTQALGVEGFPALFIASAEGKVIGQHPGYADAAQMMALLNKAPAPTPAKVASPPAKPVVVIATETEADRLRRMKEQIDADLAALYPKIAAGLDR